MAARAAHSETTHSTRYQPLLVVAIAVCAGIVAERYWPVRFTLLWLIAVALLSAWFASWRARRQLLAGWLLASTLAATGAAWHEARWSLFDADEIAAVATDAAQPVCLEAIALAGPRLVPAPQFDPLKPIATPDRCRLELQVTSARDADSWQPASGKVTLSVAGHVLGIRAGDRVRIFAQLSAATPPQNPGEFDYAEYLRADRQLCRLTAEHPACVTLVSSGSVAQPARWLDRARQSGNRALWSNLERPQSGLALALVMGQREQLDAAATRQFYETGTVHLLSISGLHVGLLAMVLFYALQLGFVRRGPALAAVAVITAVYALVIDAEPPAVRATVMVWLVCLALYSGRPQSPFNLLAAAALVVLAMNPVELFRAGTQLSFLAVAALIWLGPRLNRRPASDPLTRLIARSRPWPVRTGKILAHSLWFALAISTAIWLVSAPLVLARFNLLSPVSVLLSPLLALPITIGLLSGFILVSCGWLIWPLSIPIGWACDASLAMVSGTVDFANQLPASHFWLPGPEWWWLVGFYGLIGCWAADVRLRPPIRWCVALLAAWSAIGFLAARSAGPVHDRLDCTFLSVGHGCAAVLELPDGKTLLYDAGQLGSPLAAARSISSFLWSRGRTHLDAVVISHADIDHYNALPELLRRFSVGAVYVSPVMFENTTAATETLHRAIVAARVPLVEVHAGDRLQAADDCTIEILHPPARGALGSDNSNSVVMEVVYRGRRVLFPGDLEPPGLDDFLAERPLDCDVVLAPHHGSMQSDPPGFAAWTTPEWVVVSGDRRSRRPEAVAAYRDQGASVLNTSQVGAVTVSIHGSLLNVNSWRPAGAHEPAEFFDAGEFEDSQ